MIKYRDGLGIIADILHAAGNGAKKTHIMYFANLSYGLLEKYLWATVQSGFLRLNGDGYEVTERGQAFLEKYLAFSSRSSKLENELQSVEFERETLKRMCQLLENGKPKARSAKGRKRRE
jgi:predicted transcriptional regulator